MQDDRGLIEAVIGDGRPLLLFTGLVLVLSGAFAIFQAGTGHFLPHDEAFLGMDAAALCQLYECRILAFMIHDRVAFGGALMATGLLYLWLVEFPLRHKHGWAWWALLTSSLAGFLSFLTYLSYNYLDSWHGVATLLLLPCFLLGLVQSYRVLQPGPWRSLIKALRPRVAWRTPAGWGYLCLALTAIGLLGAGAVISIGGMTRVFVPQDLHYMALTVADLQVISDRLVPLIAHDRASFGGAIFSAGLAMAFCISFGRPSRSLWQILLLAGGAGFGCAIGVHFVVGYLNTAHLLPAYLGALIYALGLWLTYPLMMQRRSRDEPPLALPAT